jgi:hypothetical protein
MKFKLISWLIVLLSMTSLALAITATVPSFTGQSNPFNITFTGNQNQSFILPIPQDGYVQNVSLFLTPLSYSYTFNFINEIANQSSYTGFWTNPTNVNDTDYSTYGTQGADHLATSYFYENYTIPTGVTVAKEHIKYGCAEGYSVGPLTNDFLIPNSCFNSTLGKIQIRLFASYVSPDINSGFDCFNGISWLNVLYYNSVLSASCSNIFEDGMYFGNTVYSNYSIYINNIKTDNFVNLNLSINSSLNITLINNILALYQLVNITLFSTNISTLQVNLTNATYSYGIDNCSGIGIGSNATAYNISFYNTNNVPQSTTYSVSLNYADNFSYTNTRQNFSLCVYPAWANLYSNMFISYQNTSYSASNILFSNATQLLKLYLQSGTTPVLFSVVDSSTRPVPDAYIYITKWDSSTNSYLATETLKTDSNGEAIGNIVLLTDWYKFVIVYNGETKLIDPETQGVKIYTTTRIFRINTGTGTDWFDNYNKAYNIGGTVAYNNLTNSFSFTWVDTDSNADYGCLLVTKRNSSGGYTLSDNCVTTATGTIVYAITPINGTTYTGQGYIKIDNSTYIIDTLEKKFSAGFTKLKDSGKDKEALLMGVLIIMALVLAGLPYPELSAILFIFGIIITSVIGLWEMSLGMICGIIIMIGIHLFMGNKK